MGQSIREPGGRYAAAGISVCGSSCEVGAVSCREGSGTKGRCIGSMVEVRED